MKTPTAFEHHITRVKRLARIQTLNRMLLLTTFIFLCGYTVIAISQRVPSLSLEVTPRIYGILMGGAFMVAVLYSIATRIRFLNILIDIDARLKLRDRLSTAYEYTTTNKPSEFLDLLVDDAGRRLSNLTRSQLFPFRFSWLHLLILVVILFNAILIGLDYVFPKRVATPLDSQASEQIQKTIEKYLTKMQEQEEQAENRQEARQQLQRQLERMAKQLEQEKLTRKEVIESLQQNLKEVQSKQEQLTQELDTHLKSFDNLRDLPVREMPNLQQLSQQELKKFERMLSEALGGALPQDMQQNMEILRQNQEMEAMLKEMMNNVDKTDRGEDSTDQGRQKGAGSKGTGNNDENTMADQDMSHADASMPDGMPSYEDGQAENGMDGERMPWMEGDDLEDESNSSIPGTSPGNGRMYPKSTIERSQDSPFQDRMAPSKKPEYNAPVRTVTTIGAANVPEEDVMRVYERELESILQKEDIPLNYREYIKTYFMSIGVTNDASQK